MKFFIFFFCVCKLLIAQVGREGGGGAWNIIKLDFIFGKFILE